MGGILANTSGIKVVVHVGEPVSKEVTLAAGAPDTYSSVVDGCNKGAWACLMSSFSGILANAEGVLGGLSVLVDGTCTGEADFST